MESYVVLVRCWLCKKQGMHVTKTHGRKYYEGPFICSRGDSMTVVRFAQTLWDFLVRCKLLPIGIFVLPLRRKKALR